jgi:hypothetical protein
MSVAPLAAQQYTMLGARTSAAAALAPVLDDDPDVYPAFVDALTPPAIWLQWEAPWVMQRPGPTLGACTWQAQLTVVLWVHRVEPEPGVDQLETMFDHVTDRFRQAGLTWPLIASRPPGKSELGGLPLLVATLTYQVPIIGGA